ncbi:CHASE3 domain-containing protein [Microvirga aerilata]|uniref:histidine kinase n=1 Tax=Microvirga aerilata TaxID=670292 RepID=A0A936Z940_9HYPH|nr:sensor histidine kinase [Microvirga aerilata]MBL0403210.1 CHASE3 domain-containing protein [Microvirga aerilata]
MLPFKVNPPLRWSSDASPAQHGTDPEPPRFGSAAVTAAFVLAGALMVASAIALNLILSSLGQNRVFVLQTSAMLREMAELHVDVRAAETGQRGYILTGERRYLAPYDRAVGKVWTSFGTLEGAVRDPAQKIRLQRLRGLVEDKLDELSQTVSLRQQGFDAALAVVRTDVGQKLMEDIDAAIVDLENAQQSLLASRTRQLENQAAWATGIAVLGGVSALVSTILGMLWLSRQRANAKLLEAERRFRQDLERQVESRTAELTQVNRELDAFAYTISHDLRAPLRSMHGYADALVEDYGASLPEEGRGFTQRIVAAADRMDNLIQDILTYSRLARGEVNLRPVALEQIVHQVLAHSEQMVSEARAEIEVERPLPSVKAHPPTLVQAVENLISNAIKFVPPGNRPYIRIRAERQANRVRLWFEDNGIGIDPAHQERVFQPFQRLHGVEAYPGTGIGLAIVRRSLERMGGECGVISKPGEGSRFWIELPAAEEGTQ